MLFSKRLKIIKGVEWQVLRYDNVFPSETEKELLEYVMLACKGLPTYKKQSDKEDTIF